MSDLFGLLTIVFAVGTLLCTIRRNGLMTAILFVATLVSAGATLYLSFKEAAAHWTIFDAYVWIGAAAAYGIACYFRKKNMKIYGLCFIALGFIGFASSIHHIADYGALSELFSFTLDGLVILWGVNSLLPKMAPANSGAADPTKPAAPPETKQTDTK